MDIGGVMVKRALLALSAVNHGVEPNIKLQKNVDLNM
jgi:hypothetical protein